MKFKLKDKKILVILLAIVVICLLLTGMILMSLTKETNAKVEKYWFFKESIKTGQPITIENAFLVSNSNGQLSFVHENNTYYVDGTLEQEVKGVVNLLVSGDEIIKVYSKPDSIEGILDSYTDNTLFLSDASKDVSNIELLRNDSVPVYYVDGENIVQKDWNSFIIGISNIECVLENGKVCAIIIKEDVMPNDIRVVIKNGTNIFYDELFIKKQSDSSLIDVNTFLKENKTTSMEISDSSGLVICNSAGKPIKDAYEGSFRIIKTENGLVLVNEVTIETYLKYVVPSEMPTSFGKEALKCQAVCARTYAYAQMYNQTYAMYGANLDDSTSFQVYHDTEKYKETDEAVEETAGEVITRNGELITSYYYSTSPMDTNSPFYEWTSYLDISSSNDPEYGALKDIKIIEMDKKGYVTKIELIYENGVKTITNEYYIRKELGKFMEEVVLSNEKIRTDLSILPSSCFKIMESSDNKIILKGGGFGHGIGMSQYGAKQMSDNGYSYIDIIKYYYDNVAVKEL